MPLRYVEYTLDSISQRAHVWHYVINRFPNTTRSITTEEIQSIWRYGETAASAIYIQSKPYLQRKHFYPKL